MLLIIFLLKIVGDNMTGWRVDSSKTLASFLMHIYTDHPLEGCDDANRLHFLCNICPKDLDEILIRAFFSFSFYCATIVLFTD